MIQSVIENRSVILHINRTIQTRCQPILTQVVVLLSFEYLEGFISLRYY